ncbi:PREDICTED: small integral membrane protein 19 [Tinamus guttatus]|nr:PREDICTED: small integral membrane protein 19 [Tinamus guttatus]
MSILLEKSSLAFRHGRGGHVGATVVVSVAARCHGAIRVPRSFRRNKRRIMRIFTLPAAADTPPEPNFYDSMKKIRLRQQLEMYSIARKYEQQQQPPKQTESIQLSVE